MQFVLNDFRSWYGFVTPVDGCNHFHIFALNSPASFYVSGYVYDSEYVVTNMCSYCALDEFRSAVDEFVTKSSEIIRFNVDDDDEDFKLFKSYFDDIRSSK